MSVPLPGLPPVRLEHGDINFAADSDADTTDDDSTCTGSSSVPTAPPGKLCIYVWAKTGVEGLSANAPFIETPDFVVLWNVKSAGDQYVFLHWAYTAP